MTARHARTAMMLVALVAACQSEPTSGPVAIDRPTASSDVAPTVACTDCVFGPATYTREQGKPALESATFAADPTVTYVVDIDDLGTDGADGSVVLNGMTLLAPRAPGEEGPRHVTLEVSLAASNLLEVRPTGRPGSQLQVTIRPACFPDLPAPQIVLERVHTETVGGNLRDFYELDVTNRASFPNVLFAPAPNLPPCGLNTSASRTWVEIYTEDAAGNDVRIFGLCALGSAEALNGIWFNVPAGSTPPSPVFIRLRDRRCGIVYESNKITLP